MTQLLFVRHGVTEYNCEGRLQGHLNSALTPRGELQADQLGNRLSSWPITACYSSDLGRTIDTAKRLTRLPIRSDPRLREQHFGDFQGKTFPEISHIVPIGRCQEYGDVVAGVGGVDVCFPNGEDQRQVFSRAYEAVKDIAKAHQGEMVLIVTHGVVLTVLLKHFLGQDIATPRAFTIQNTALNIVELDAGGQWLVRAIGDTAHQEGPQSQL